MGEGSSLTLVIPEHLAGQRLDRALAEIAEAEGLVLSRSRLAALIAEGAVTGPAGAVSRSARVTAGEGYAIALPAPVDPEPQPEDIPLEIAYEDADLIVVNKPAGMVVHPAPGAETGTLVNALLHHCGDSLAGIGGERRPGIVHRIDKDTSGLLVAAKTEAAHAGLSRLFATHDIERRYLAITWGAPDRADPRLMATEGVTFPGPDALRVETQIGRDPKDRKRMAVVPSGGRNAITWMQVRQRLGPDDAPVAAMVECRLETGRTHQIRVHAAHIGHALIGDPVYARAREISARRADPETRAAVAAFPRQALHAAQLGFQHPVSGENLRFKADLPADLNGLFTLLRRNT